MNREQTTALATLIARGAGHALDVGRPGDDYEGIAEAALAYARACGWLTPKETAGLQAAAHEHVTCRIALQAARARIDALEVALAAVLGAARVEPTHIENLENALTEAGDVLQAGPETT